ncbi:MAG: hypothetical protein Q9183_006584, partial [Haloplaca sp. 2 TL-2023]
MKNVLVKQNDGVGPQSRILVTCFPWRCYTCASNGFTGGKWACFLLVFLLCIFYNLTTPQVQRSFSLCAAFEQKNTKPSDQRHDMLTSKEVPFQASNLTELATKAIRHGMTWTCFRPELGVFLAEGQGHILRRLPQPDLIIEYIPDPRLRVQISNSLYIDSPAVDKLFFGMLEGDRSLNLPDYRIGTTEEVYGTMYSLDPTGTATKKIRDNRHPSFAPKCLFGFSDIIPLAAPFLHETMLQEPKQSHPIRLPIPAQYTTGLLSHKEGFVVFSHRLDAFINSPRY